MCECIHIAWRTYVRVCMSVWVCVHLHAKTLLKHGRLFHLDVKVMSLTDSDMHKDGCVLNLLPSRSTQVDVTVSYKIIHSNMCVISYTHYLMNLQK